MAFIPDIDVDVLIVGAGPIGLNLAYQLRRFSCPPAAGLSATEPISVHIIEALPKPIQETFGRAVTFWPRSVEMLSQLGLGSSIMQHCFAVRSSAAYDINGNEVFGRGWSFLEGISDTRYRFASVLRQKHVEDLFRAESKALGVGVAENHEFLDLEIRETVAAGEKGRVRARVLDRSAGDGKHHEYFVNCRYLIGCDGSKTVVRGAAGIESDGSRTEDKWVRVDGVLKSTTMPKPRSYGSLENPVYGNVLWIPLDHGATRIGFSLSEERRKMYEEVNEDVFVKEALLSLAPFEAEFERVDWASVYSVGQRLARNFWTKKSVFIAGDAAHSHSSGAGQGMNTGIHDAVNLGWKLALTLTGVLKPEVLETYELERRPNAKKLIDYDENISTLITGRLPSGWKGDQDPNVALGEIFKEAKGFNTGLTIAYEKNMAVWKEVEKDGDDGADGKTGSTIPAPAIPGYRAPEIQLLLPALWDPVWLQDLTVNVARFYILIFLGKSEESRDNYLGLKSHLEQNGRLVTEQILGTSGMPLGPNMDNCSASTRPWPVDFLTILPKKASNAWVELGGTNPLGKVYYDVDDGSGGRRYDVDSDTGTVFILRPDGFIGAKLPLVPKSAADVVGYLGGLLN
ncbi:hypothetical protein GQ53DRAFT_348370 [Thozetella sp. PMI_491]|nr:hypothetical protein GQ53DRAFT_348370 [Thozetella sp. PMI_491]